MNSVELRPKYVSLEFTSGFNIEPFDSHIEDWHSLVDLFRAYRWQPESSWLVKLILNI